MDTPRVFRRSRLILGESLIWNDDELWWCDISAGVIHSASGAKIAVPPPLASFGPTTDGRWIASLGASVVLLSADGSIEPLASIEHRHPGMRLNEGKSDPAGRWITGSMELMTTDEADGAFYSITADGTVRVLCGGVGVGNGLEWSLDGSRIYYTDTSVETIYTAEYSVDGSLSKPEIFHHGEPHDGLAMDVEGCLWSAHYGKGTVARYDQAGRELDRVSFPAPNLTSVAFGGADLATLFVTSARENLSEHDLVEHPLSGSVFSIETETRGLPPRVFAANGPATVGRS
jgi:sugar lactone lactonase YvrE